MRRSALVINKRDGVAVALSDIESGAKIEIPGGVVLRAVSDIPCGHKVALFDLAGGEPVLKYGEVIGRASGDIKAGDWVHTHNMETA